MLDSKLLNSTKKIIIFANLIIISLSIIFLSLGIGKYNLISAIMSLFFLFIDILLYLFLEKIIIYFYFKKYFKKENRGILKSSYFKSEELETKKNSGEKEITVDVICKIKFKNHFSKKLELNFTFLGENPSFSKNFSEKNIFTFKKEKKLTYFYKNNGKGNGGYIHQGYAIFNLKTNEIEYWSFWNENVKLSKGKIILNVST